MKFLLQFITIAQLTADLAFSHQAFLRCAVFSSVLSDSPGALIFDRFASMASRIAADPPPEDMAGNSTHPLVPNALLFVCVRLRHGVLV